MIEADIDWVQNNQPTQIRSGKLFSTVNGHLCVDGQIALPLDAVSSVYASDTEIQVDDEAGGQLGVLCVYKDSDVNLSSASETMYLAYLTEIPREQYGHPYSFRKNYFVVNESRYDEYVQSYMPYSSVWGEFLHANSGISYLNGYTSRLTSITAFRDLRAPTAHHEENLVRSIVQPFGFERFLKQYHLLELLFDYDLVSDIRSLPSDLKGIGQLLSNYRRNDIDRLDDIVKRRCRDATAIEKSLNSVTAKPEYISMADVLFFNYGKESNPLSKKRSEFLAMLTSGGFSVNNAATHNVLTKNKNNPTVFQANYEEFIKEIACYWVFRIRCSIAHSRIGEYVMSNSDEEFVVEVGQTILRELVRQCFI